MLERHPLSSLPGGLLPMRVGNNLLLLGDGRTRVAQRDLGGER